jgi:MFS family permease
MERRSSRALSRASPQLWQDRPVPAALEAMRGSLTNPAIRRLQLAFAGSAIGQWACSTAVTVFSFTAGGAAAVSLQLVLRMVPSALAAPFLSTFADRYPRVRVMVVADLLRVAIVTAMGVLVLFDAPYVLVLVASGLSGIVATAFEPAKAALLPSLAERPEQLTAANAVSNSIDSVSFFAGPALAGLLLAVSSTHAVLFVTAGTLLWSALLVSRINEAPPTRADGQAEPGMLAQVAEGIGAVRDDARVRLLLTCFAAQTFVDGALTVLLAAVALDLLGLGASGLGLLSAATGVGGVAGIAASAVLTGRRRLGPAFALGMILWGLPLVALGLAPVTVVAVAALAMVGVANTLVDVSGMTLLQRAAPDDVIGRVFGLLDTLILASVALGSVAAGVMLAVAGVEAALIATGAVLPVLIALRWRAVLAVDGRTVSPEDVALLQRTDVFAPLGPLGLERLAEALEPVRVAAGAAIVREGEQGDRFYLIVAGTVDVSVNGAPVREQGPGEYFGEIALLRDSPRTATITARDDVELRSLRREPFLATVAGHGGSAEAAEATAVRRLATARPVAAAG